MFFGGGGEVARGANSRVVAQDCADEHEPGNQGVCNGNGLEAIST